MSRAAADVESNSGVTFDPWERLRVVRASGVLPYRQFHPIEQSIKEA